jgi:ATP-dependent Clp protease ATP-binding subunit ClpA
MFQGVKSKLRDMSFIKLLCEAAEVYAVKDQQREPGAEHFLLAALDLPDGAARLAFEQAGVSPDDLRTAIQRQYDDALRALGLQAETLVGAPMSASTGAYQAADSGRDVMQKLAATRRGRGPLHGAHVVSVIADMSEGVAARALRALGVDPVTLKSAADGVAAASRAS